jgi:hypothetical protein
MSKRRAPSRVKEIDNFLRDNYPLHGADFCAQALSEPVKYIQARSTVIGVGKSRMMRSEASMKQRIEYLLKLNAELRIENMKLIEERIHDSSPTSNNI